MNLITGVSRVLEVCLTYLPWQDNWLAGPIPPQLSQLRLLTVLNLGTNQLGGGIPAELGELGALRYLSLFNNQVCVGVLVCWCIGVLVVNVCSSGAHASSLPPTWLPPLNNLHARRFCALLCKNVLCPCTPARRTQLEGPIPAALGLLQELRYLDLDNNQVHFYYAHLCAWNCGVYSRLHNQVVA